MRVHDDPRGDREQDRFEVALEAIEFGEQSPVEPSNLTTANQSCG